MRHPVLSTYILVHILYFRSDKICRCDADCTDFGDCCFDWSRLFHNETDSLNHRKRRFQCKKWVSNVSLISIFIGYSPPVEAKIIVISKEFKKKSKKR